MRARRGTWTFLKIAVVLMAFYQLCILLLQGITEETDNVNSENKNPVPEQPQEIERASFLSGQLKSLGKIPVEDNTAMILPQPPFDEPNMMEEEYFKYFPDKINPFVHKYIPSKFPESCESGTFMVVLIHSRPDYIDKRNAIRKTWGDSVKGSYWPEIKHKTRKLNIKMKVAFVLGQIGHPIRYTQDKITQEALLYKDIIQGDFIDSYRNMTLKSLLGLKWVLDKCPDVKFLLKSDDDMFVYLPGILERLQNLTTNRTILGPYNWKSRVYRKGKWALSLAEYPFPFFPPYESGSTYIFTGDLIRPLFEASEHVKPLFVDDVYITGILGKLLKVNHAAQGGFSWGNSKKPTLCSFLNNSLVAGTKVKPGYMLDLWDAFKGQGDLYITC